MNNKVIVIVGSSNRLVETLKKEMQDNAILMGKKYKIFSDSTVRINRQFTSNEHLNIDILLLTPQLSFMKDKLAQKGERFGIAVDVVSLMDYSLSLGGSALLKAEQALALENKKVINQKF